MSIQGVVDGCDSTRIWGWAWDPEDLAKRVKVDIFCNESLIGSVVADKFGPDLRNAGIGTGYHRWSFDLPEFADDKSSEIFELRVRSTEERIELRNNPKRICRSLLELVKDQDPKAILATLYLHGSGIEIGALYNPLRVPAGVKVKYVDRMSVEDLRHHYPELTNYNLVPVEIIDNGEKLSKLSASSQDFVIANHFLEHCEDPIDTLINMLRVLKENGVLFITVPNKRCTLDAPRPVTEMSHLIADHLDGPEKSRLQHYREWARVIEKNSTDESVEARAQEQLRTSYSIHFHVFTEFEIMELLVLLRKRFEQPCTLLQLVNNGCHETIFVLRKGG